MHIAAAAQVAEENPKLASILAAGGLASIARLDTCIVLIDVWSVLQEYRCAKLTRFIVQYGE